MINKEVTVDNSKNGIVKIKDFSVSNADCGCCVEFRLGNSIWLINYDEFKTIARHLQDERDYNMEEIYND